MSSHIIKYRSLYVLFLITLAALLLRVPALELARQAALAGHDTAASAWFIVYTLLYAPLVLGVPLAIMLLSGIRHTPAAGTVEQRD